jgi:succinate dehydrogenase / fumarate reductase, membrane anchor subunit
MQISPVSRGRQRPTGGRAEVWIWYLIRLTGVALFVLALAHFSIVHFVYDPADQTAEWIRTQRWDQLFWRGMDWALLMMVLFHAFLGVRTVLLDYIRGARARLVTMSVVYLMAIALFVMGSVVVFTLPSTGPIP